MVTMLDSNSTAALFQSKTAKAGKPLLGAVHGGSLTKHGALAVRPFCLLSS